jgi:hypothetical protein
MAVLLPKLNVYGIMTLCERYSRFQILQTFCTTLDQNENRTFQASPDPEEKKIYLVDHVTTHILVFLLLYSGLV